MVPLMEGWKDLIILNTHNLSYSGKFYEVCSLAVAKSGEHISYPFEICIQDDPSTPITCTRIHVRVPQASR